MCAKKAGAQPKPAPTNEISARLEQIRDVNGITLKEFVERLNMPLDEGDTFVANYSSARYYHYDREPPAPYLARVADVFGARLEWLITGRGEPTEMEAALREPEPDRPHQGVRATMDERLRAAFPPYDALSNHARGFLLEVLMRAFQDTTLHPEHPLLRGGETGDSAVAAVADWIGSALGGPVNQFGAKLIREDELEDYVVLMCQALARLIPSPRERVEMVRLSKPREETPA